MHGMDGSSADFMLNWPDKSPAFILANQGYDVWLGNNRGNTYSNRHSTLKSLDNLEDYWNFDAEKMGMQDVPSMIDFILETTNKKVLDAYIGYDQGNTQFWMAASQMSQYYKDRVNLFVSLAPVLQNHR